MTRTAVKGNPLSRIPQPSELRAIEELKRRLLVELPGQVKDIILFSSTARGDAHPGSDIDLLVIVDRRTPEMADVISEITADTQLGS